jgi:hypothetical protein
VRLPDSASADIANPAMTIQVSVDIGWSPAGVERVLAGVPQSRSPGLLTPDLSSVSSGLPQPPHRYPLHASVQGYRVLPITLILLVNSEVRRRG